ncbi:hypothetical protein [Anaerobiospirillum thomasii]|nr:hypothetical protein [Anaerobiospirillum thomasii]
MEKNINTRHKSGTKDDLNHPLLHLIENNAASDALDNTIKACF